MTNNTVHDASCADEHYTEAVKCNLTTVLVFIAVAHTLTFLPYWWLLRTTPHKRNVPWRERVYSHLNHSWLGVTVSSVYGVFSVISCVLFIIETYTTDDDENEHMVQPIWFTLAEIALQPMFVWNYLLVSALHLPSWSYVFSLPAIVDKITVIPVYVDLGMRSAYLPSHQPEVHG